MSEQEEVHTSEDKRQRFERIAKLRVSNAITKIRLLHNLANTAGYDFTETHVDAIIHTLRSEVDTVETLFLNSLKGKGRTEVQFEFKLDSE